MSEVPSYTRRPTRKSAKGEATAERILDSAEELFAERGFAGTTLRDVATAVGIRIPSLYNHFDSKDALYEAVLQRGLQPAFQALVEYVAPRSTGGESPRLLVDRIMRVTAEHPRLAGLIQHETLTGAEHLNPMLQRWLTPIFEKGYEMVDVGGATKRWDADELNLLMLAMYHITVGYFTIAPLYQDLNGVDLLADEMLEKQIRVFGDIVSLIFNS